jgi:pimeloyl-[acyl-carrier protein] methyl ester esterase
MSAKRQLALQTWGNEAAAKQCLLIHGWGMNSAVWNNVASALSVDFPERFIQAVDLPGFGYSAEIELDEDYNSKMLADWLKPMVMQKLTTVIAWSMGGLPAIDLLEQCPGQIERLILVASSPKFVQDEDWLEAVEPEIFESFCQSLSDDPQATLRRFLAIQTMGSKTAREDIRTLQEALATRGNANQFALRKGLEMLLIEDKRVQMIKNRGVPVDLICGERDTLVKLEAQKLLAQQANVSIYSIPGAGHAPFISHPNEFQAILTAVLSAE